MIIALHSTYNNVQLLLWLVTYLCLSVKTEFKSTREDLIAILVLCSFTLIDWHKVTILMHSTLLGMSILYVTSTQDKFPILLHWLYCKVANFSLSKTTWPVSSSLFIVCSTLVLSYNYIPYLKLAKWLARCLFLQIYSLFKLGDQCALGFLNINWFCAGC